MTYPLDLPHGATSLLREPHSGEHFSLVIVPKSVATALAHWVPNMYGDQSLQEDDEPTTWTGYQHDGGMNTVVVALQR